MADTGQRPAAAAPDQSGTTLPPTSEYHPPAAEVHPTPEQQAGVVSQEIRTPFHKGAPSAIGVPLFVAGSVVLGLSLINFAPTSQVGAPIAIILAATGLFVMIAAIWAAALGESIVAGIFGIFAGFWLSYSVLVLGLIHNWFGLTAPAGAPLRVLVAYASATQRTVEIFLIAWLAVICTLTLATLRLPLAFTGIFVLVDAALASVLVGTIQSSQTWHTVAGGCVFAFAAIGLWVFLDTMQQAAGGRPIPLGRPILR